MRKVFFLVLMCAFLLCGRVSVSALPLFELPEPLGESVPLHLQGESAAFAEELFDLDFSVSAAYRYASAVNGNASSFEEGAAGIVVFPKENADTYLRLSRVLPAERVTGITVYFDASEDYAHFTEDMTFDGLFFGHEGERRSTARKLRPDSLTAEDGLLAVHFSTAHEKWTDTIAFVDIDPYNGKPDWKVCRVCFEVAEQTPVEELVVVGLAAPLTGEAYAAIPHETGGFADVHIVSWSPELGEGGVADADTAYTATLSLIPKKDSRFTQDTHVTVNGTPTEAVCRTDGSLTVTVAFEKTAYLALHTVSFNGAGLKTAPQSVKVYEGKMLDLRQYFSVTPTDASKRFNGWSLSPSDDLFDAVYDLAVTENVMLYPVISYDFNFAVPANMNGWSFSCCSGRLENDCLVLTQTGESVDVKMTKYFVLDADLFCGVTAYFDPDCFNDTLLDGLFFSHAGESDDRSRMLSPKKAGRACGYETVFYDAKNATAWTGMLSKLRYDPFQSDGSTSLRALVFGKCPSVDADVFTMEGLTVPTTGMTDNGTQKAAETTGNAAVIGVSWSPELQNGRFDEKTVYTATVTLAPKKGYLFDLSKAYTVSFGNMKSAAEVLSERTLAAEFVFDETQPYSDVSLTLTGETACTVGIPSELTVKLNGDVPDRTVLFESSDESVAGVDENGVLHPVGEGNAVIKAICAYRPEVYDELAVAVSFYPFAVSVNGADEIKRGDRTVLYRFAVSDKNVPDASAKWSTDDPTIAVIDEDSGRLTPLGNGTVTVRAVSCYNSAVYAEKTVTISGQSASFTVFYDSAARDRVTGLPEPTVGKGTVFLSSAVPEREGYFFLGWSKSPDSVETETQLTVSGDTTVYAVWGKGIVWDLRGGNSRFSSVASGSMRNSPEGLVCSTNASQIDIRLTAANVHIDPKRCREICVLMAAEEDGQAQFFYQSEYTAKNGERKKVGYNINSDGSSGYNYAAAMSVSTAYEGEGLGVFRPLFFPVAEKNGAGIGKWGDPATEEIVGLWFDPYDGANRACVIRAVAFLDPERTVTFDAGTAEPVSGMPLAFTAAFGETVTVKDVPTRAGYRFLGWTAEENGVTLPKRTFAVTDDLTLRAAWAASPRMVSDGDDKRITRFAENLDAEHNDTLAVKTDAPRGATMTLTFVCDGKEETVTASVNALGYAVFDLAAYPFALEDAAVALPERFAVSETIFTKRAYWDALTETMLSEPKKSSSSGEKVYDTAVTDVTAETPIFMPVTDEKTEQPSAKGVMTVRELSQGGGNILFGFENETTDPLFPLENRMPTLYASDSVLTVGVLPPETAFTGTPAYLQTDVLSLDAEVHRYVIIKVRADTAGGLDLAFRTENGRFSESKTARGNVGASWTMLVYDMAAFETWRGTVTGLRLMPEGSAERLEIDWILFSDDIPSSMETIGGVSDRFPVVRTEDIRFEDVTAGDWFAPGVRTAYRRGMMIGVSETRFDPDGTLTKAQAVMLAMRLYTVCRALPEIAANGEPWYAPVMEAAKIAGLIGDEFGDPDTPITRRDFAVLIAKALPTQELPAVNMFRSLPDVTRGDAGFASILKLYNAGILTGENEDHAFFPDSFLTRAQAAAVVTRVVSKADRVRVVTAEELEARKIRYDPDDLIYDAALGNCEKEIFVNRSGRAYAMAATDDPCVMLTALFRDLSCEDVKTVRVGMKWDSDAVGAPEKNGCTLFFTTEDGGWSPQRAVGAQRNGEPDIYGVCEFVFDMLQNEQWKGELTGVRFDPFDARAAFELSYLILE